MALYNTKHYLDETCEKAVRNVEKPVLRAKNRTTGKKQQQSGQEFERQLEGIHRWYATQRIALISKVPTDMAYRDGKWIPAHRTGADFLGVYRGQAVAIESKQTSTATRFDLFTRGKGNSTKKTVADHQQRYLLQHKRCGGKAYVLIKIKPTGSLYRLDIEEYMKLEEEALESGNKSISVGSLEPYKVIMNGRNPDYLKEETE